MTTDISADELKVFLQEAESLLATLDEHIVRLEQEGPAADLVQEIFRVAHTLKGSSGMLGLDRMTHVTHQMEDLFDRVRKGTLGITEEIIDALLMSLDVLRVLKDDVAAGVESSVDVSQVVDALRRAADSPVADAPGQAAESVSLLKSLRSDAALREQVSDARAEHPVLHLQVTLDSQNQWLAVRCFQLLNELDQWGEVLVSSPTQADIEAEQVTSRLEALISLRGEPDASALDAALRAIDDVRGTEIVAVEAFHLLDHLPEPGAGAAPGAPASESVAAAAAPRSEPLASSVRVDVEQIDALMNMVGELVIDRTRVSQLSRVLSDRFDDDDVRSLGETSVHLEKLINELHERMMQIRMLPVGLLFSKFPRLVRDLSRSLGKSIRLELDGEDTEIDRSVIEQIKDPLVHLIRNACDHGIEDPLGREANGKPEISILKLSASHQQGQIVITLVPEPFALGHAGYLRHYLDTGEESTDTGLVVGHDRPTFALHREGFQIPISLQVAEASTGDGHRVFTGVIHDLTQQSHREGERLQMLESLMKNQRGVVVGTMVGGVAHDFNNLLTAIVGALDLEISARGQSSRWLDHAAGAARRAAVVVRRLLHAARPGGSELLPTDVREAIRDTVELARETFDRRVVIRIAAGPDMPLVLADATRIEQVLLNLLLNARDATLDRIEGAGSGYVPEIHITAGATQADDGTPIVRITISDNGTGMTAAIRDRLFDPFFTTKGADHGTGLGMTMVREIVREFDGSISVESTHGVGTTFTLDLPVSVDDAPMSLTESPSGKRRILVVDDEETIRDIVGEALKRAGYDSVGVPNAEEAIEVLRFAARFDLVLLNLNMAGLSGWDALAWIHAHQAGVPVVIMSGSVRIAEASRRGATAVLEKPFPVDSLLAVVESALNSPAGGSGAI